jgi:hypothetical protein
MGPGDCPPLKRGVSVWAGKIAPCWEKSAGLTGKSIDRKALIVYNIDITCGHFSYFLVWITFLAFFLLG